jgi:hypothetical protein
MRCRSMRRGGDELGRRRIWEGERWGEAGRREGGGREERARRRGREAAEEGEKAAPGGEVEEEGD